MRSKPSSATGRASLITAPSIACSPRTSSTTAGQISSSESRSPANDAVSGEPPSGARGIRRGGLLRQGAVGAAGPAAEARPPATGAPVPGGESSAGSITPRLGGDLGGSRGRRLDGAGEGGAGGPRLQALDPGQQRLQRAVELGAGGLHERELQARAGVGAGTDALHRLAEELQQAQDLVVADAGGLFAQRLVGLGGERQLGRDFLEGLHEQQLAGTRLEVAGQRGRVVALLGALLERPQGARRVAAGDGVDRSRAGSAPSATPSTASASSRAISLPL